MAEEEKKTTSLKVSPKLWIEVKVHCAREQIDISDYIEGLVKKDLRIKA